MPHYGLLRDYRGSNVYGRNDEKLGEVVDVIFDHQTGVARYVVVSAASWFSHKKFLVPSHRLHTWGDHENHFAVNLDKQQTRSLPEYKESDLQSAEKLRDYEQRHDAAWHAGPVQPRESSDHHVTPTPEELPPGLGAARSLLTPSKRAEVNSRIIPATGFNQAGWHWITLADLRTGVHEGWRDLTPGGAQPVSRAQLGIAPRKIYPNGMRSSHPIHIGMAMACAP